MATIRMNGSSSNIHGSRALSTMEVMRQLSDQTQRQRALRSQASSSVELDDPFNDRDFTNNSLESHTFNSTETTSSLGRWESLLVVEKVLSNDLPLDILQSREGIPVFGSLGYQNISLDGLSFQSNESMPPPPSAQSWQRTLLANPTIPTPCPSSDSILTTSSTAKSSDLVELGELLGPPSDANDPLGSGGTGGGPPGAAFPAALVHDSDPGVSHVTHTFSRLSTQTTRPPQSPVTRADAEILLHLSTDSSVPASLRAVSMVNNGWDPPSVGQWQHPMATTPVPMNQNESNVKNEELVTKVPKRKRKRPVDDESLREYITERFTEQDVILGRGGLANNHAGNKTYLEFKKSLQERYMAVSKYEKTSISEELVQWVHNRGGRFLDRDAKSGRWYQVSLLKARKKASQTLRENYTPETLAEKRAKYPKKGSDSS